MPTVRYIGRSSYALRDGPRFDTENREAAVSSDTAERLVSGGPFEYVTEPDYSDGETSGDSSDGETTDGYTCVGMDGDCSRSVDEQGGYCWQHP